MGADQIAELAPAILEVASAAADEAWCATFTINGDDAVWVQVTRHEINFSYPFEVDPSQWLTALEVEGADVLELLVWEPRRYATLAGVDELTPKVVARVVDAIVTGILDAPTGYTLGVELMCLDG
ncbi:MAG: hypothetical protein R3B13_20530 [Polyangiaceae bacterium]